MGSVPRIYEVNSILLTLYTMYINAKTQTHVQRYVYLNIVILEYIEYGYLDTSLQKSEYD